MDLRRFTGVKFVSRAPTRSGGEIELRVTKMEPAHVLWWDFHVQPKIGKDPQVRPALVAAGWREFLRQVMRRHRAGGDTVDP